MLLRGITMLQIEKERNFWEFIKLLEIENYEMNTM